jgi:hypothetical protein
MSYQPWNKAIALVQVCDICVRYRRPTYGVVLTKRRTAAYEPVAWKDDIRIDGSDKLAARRCSACVTGVAPATVLRKPDKADIWISLSNLRNDFIRAITGSVVYDNYLIAGKRGQADDRTESSANIYGFIICNYYEADPDFLDHAVPQFKRSAG